MARLIKCRGCDDKFEKEILKIISNKNYCPRCYKAILTEREHREELYSTIKEFYNIEFPTGWMLKQIKEFTEIRGYKLKGITLTLIYCKEQLNLRFDSKYGLAIIPNYYNSAKNYWLEKQKRALNHKDVKIQTEKIIIPKMSFENKYKKNKLIDLEALACKD